MIENTNSNLSESNEPRLISSRASSRMLFADLNIEDIEWSQNRNNPIFINT